MNKPTNCSKTFTTINRIMRKCPHHYLVSFPYCRYLNYLNLNNEESVLFKNSYLRNVRLCTECTMHYPAELKVFINEVINYSMYNIWTVKLHGAALCCS